MTHDSAHDTPQDAQQRIIDAQTPRNTPEASDVPLAFQELCKTRMQFLTLFPHMTAWLTQAETRQGLLQCVGAVPLPSGRLILLARFAQAWSLFCVNPENPPDHRHQVLVLSPEALEAVVILWEALRVQAGPPYAALQAALEAQRTEELPCHP